MSGGNVNVTGSGASHSLEQITVDKQVRVEDGRAYVKVVKDGKHYRLSAEGLFGDRLRTFADSNRTLSENQIQKLVKMVDTVFFSTGQIKSTKTLDIKFADNISKRVEDLCNQRYELLEGFDGSDIVEHDFVTHAAFEGVHVAKFSNYVAQSYIALCREWKELDDQTAKTQHSLDQTQNFRDEIFEVALQDGGDLLGAKEQQLEQLQQKHESLEIGLQASKDRLLMEPDNDALQEERDRLFKELAAVKSELAQVRKDYAALSQECQQLKSTLAEREKNDPTQDLLQKIQQAKAGLDELREQNAELAQKNRDLSTKYTQKESANDTKIDALNEQIKGLAQRSAQDANALQTAEAKFKDSHSEWLNEKKSSEAKITQLETQLADLNGQKELVETKLDQAHEQMAEKQGHNEQTIAKLQTHITTLETTVQLVTTERDKTLDQAYHANSLVTTLRSELQHTQDNLATLLAERNDLALSKSALSDAVAKAQTQNDGLLQKLETLGGEAAQLSARVAEMDVLKGELALVNDQCKSANAEKSDLRAQLHSLKGALDDQRTQNRELSGNTLIIKGLQDQLERADAQIKELGSEKQNAQEKLAKEQAQTEQLLQQLISTGGEKGKIADQLNETLRAKDAMTTELARVTTSLEGVTQSLTSREGELATLSGQLDQIRGDTRAAKREHDVALSQKNEEIARLRGDLGISNAKVAELDEKASTLTNRLTGLVDRGDTLSKTLRALEEERGTLQSALLSTQAQSERLQSELHTAGDDRKAMELGHTSDRNQQIAEANALKGQVQLLGAKMGELERSKESLLNEKATLQNEVAQLRGQIDDQVAKLDETGKGRDQSVAQLANALRENGALADKVATLEDSQRALKAQASNDRAKIETLQETELTQSATLEKVSGELNGVRSDAQRKTEEIVHLNALQGTLTAKIADGEKRAQELLHQVQGLGGDKAQLASTLQEVKTRESALQRELEETTNALTNVTSQLTAGDAKNSALASQLETSREDTRAAESKLDQLNQTVEKLQTTLKMTQLNLDGVNKDYGVLQQFIESDPAGADMKPVLEKMQRDCEYYINHLPTNAVLFHSQQINFEKISSALQEIADRPESAELTQEDINTFTSAAFCQIAKGNDEWKTALAGNRKLAEKIPEQLKAFGAGLKGSVGLDLSEQKQLIGNCKRVILSGEIDKEECARVVKKIETSSRNLIRSLIKNVGIDNPPIDLSKAHEELCKPNSMLSKVIATFKPEVKEQLCVLAYYQNAIANLGKKRDGDIFSTHDQWDFLVQPSSDNELFTPKPENLLHLVDALKGSRLQGATLSSTQMGQLSDIFTMMNKGTQSANMFSAAGSGKTTIVELTMLLTGKLTDSPPQFHYISSIPSTVKDVKSHLFGNLKQKEVDGVNQILIEDAAAKTSNRRQIVFIDEAHRISSTSEVFINGSTAQNVRITATPSMRTSLLAEHGESMVENLQQLEASFSGAMSLRSSEQMSKASIEDVRGQIAKLLKALPRKDFEQVRSDVAGLKDDFFENSNISKIPVQLRDFHASLIKALKAIPETVTIQEYLTQITESNDATKFPNLTAINIAHLKGYKDNRNYQDLVATFRGTRHDLMVNMSRKKDLIALQAELTTFAETGGSGQRATQLLASALMLGVKPKESEELTSAMRVDTVARAAFVQRAADVKASAASAIAQSGFLQQVEQRRSFANISQQIGERYARVDCQNLAQLDPFVDQLKGKIGVKNQVIFPNFVLDDNKVDGVVKLFRTKLDLGADTAFLYTNAQGEKKAIVGNKHLDLTQLKSQKGVERLVMLYDERTAAGGDFEQYSQNNVEDASIRQFLLFNTQAKDSLNRAIKTDTLVQGLGRLRKGTSPVDAGNVETYLFGNQEKFGNELLEGSLFHQLQKMQEEGYRETEIHELASALTGFVTRAYTLATGGNPSGESLGVYSQVASALKKASPQDLEKLTLTRSNAAGKDSLSPAESIQSMVTMLGHLGIAAPALERINGALGRIIEGDLAAGESAADVGLNKTADLATSMTGIMQGAMQAHFAAMRLAKAGSFGLAAQAA